MRRNETKRSVFSFIILAVSLLFIGIGLMKKEYMEVLQKAVRICLECIGIG